VPSRARLPRWPGVGGELAVDHVGQAPAQAAHRPFAARTLMSPAGLRRPVSRLMPRACRHAFIQTR